MSIIKINPEWWNDCGDFFGNFYIRGDNSQQGHLSFRELSLAERTLVETDGICRLLNLRKLDRVLDVPCGYGRHSIELGRRGIEVVGVDLSDIHLERAKQQAKGLAVPVTFEHQNMLTLEYKNKFHALINMFYSFGFFQSDDDNIHVLHNFYLALKPGGKFLMHTDVNIPRIRNGYYKTKESRNLVGGGILQIEERFDESASRIIGCWTIQDGDLTESRNYSVRVYETTEFVQMCLDVGFISCITLGSWDGTPYSNEAEEVIFIAQK